MGDSQGCAASQGGAAGVEEKLVVAIRPRPLSGDAPDASLRLTPGAVEVAGEGALLFDRVFAAEADNGVVYDDVAAPVVQAVLRGISGAVAAYGQTGSGKTRTMRGVADDPGLVPRAVRAIFEHVSAQAGVREFKVSLSYFEIYNETLKDLLCPTAKLDVVEGLAGVDVRGARPTEVADLAAALRLLAEGDACRATAATAMNAQSSRSHCIVRITVESKKANAGVEGRGLVAVLSLVDLAGSETAKKTGVTSGARALEGAKINQSLFALSRVIEALSRADGSKPPFRDSKLTHLLKPALEPGAPSKTALICAVHPAAAHASETQSTLQFARKARCVVTRPVVREELSERDRARQLAEENEALQAALLQREAESAAAAAAAAEAAATEAGAQRAEAAAAAERLVAVEAEAAELRGRIARMNAAAAAHAPARMAEQPGAPDAGAGDGASMRAARRATLAGPSDAAAAKLAAAAAACAPAPAAESGEGSNALLSALAARHGATKAALAAAEAARAEAAGHADSLSQERAASDAAVASATAEASCARALAAEASALAAAAREEAVSAVGRAEEAAREAAAWRDSAAKADARWLRSQHDTAAANDRAKASGAEGARARAEAEAAAAKLGAAESRASRAEAEAASLTERLRAAETAAATARAAAAAAEAAAAAAQRQAASQAAARGADASDLERAAAAAESRAVGAEVRADLADGEVRKLRGELDAARREAWAAGERATEAEQQTQRARAAAAAADAARGRAETDAAAALQREAAAAAEAAAARETVHDAMADASDSRAAAAAAIAAVAASAAELAALRARVGALEAENAALLEVQAAVVELAAEKDAADAAARASAQEAASSAADVALLKRELAAEGAARALAEQQLDALLDEAPAGAAEAHAAAMAAAQAAEEAEATLAAAEARAAAAEARAEAAEAMLAAGTAAVSATPEDSFGSADAVDAPLPVPSAHWKAAPGDGAARAAGVATLRAVLAANPAPAAAPAPAAPAPAAPAAKAKCFLCVQTAGAAKARVGSKAHPDFPSLPLCTKCHEKNFSASTASQWADEAGQDQFCRICADGGEGVVDCDARCGAALHARCVERHFPEEVPALAAALAPGGPAWACLLCRPVFALRRTGPRPQFTVAEAAEDAPLPLPAAAPAASDDKENAGALPRKTPAKAAAAGRGGRPAGTGAKRRLGPNRALEDETLM